MSARTIYMLIIAAILTTVWLVSNDRLPTGFPRPDYELPTSASDSSLRELGRHLFYDPILSVDSSTSCATCHQQFSAFSHIDHALSHGVMGRIGKRNVPALQNLAWQTTYMWDGAIENLDMQSISPITGHEELGETLPNILRKVRTSGLYDSLFNKAYGSDTVSIPKILTALGRFSASLVSANSRYDRFIAGLDSFSLQEKRGLDVFRARCATCHTEPLFSSNQLVSNGLPVDTALMDIGRSKVSRLEADSFRFRVPSLRNVAVTHPYMHDGRYKRLREVVTYYASPELHERHADPRIRAIGILRDEERKDIIAFLLTLTDTEFLRATEHGDPFTAIRR
ncbi:MAG: cytochrome-c peroxidase [Ignavibacteria bacterium]